MFKIILIILYYKIILYFFSRKMLQVTEWYKWTGDNVIWVIKVNRKRRIKFFQLKSRFIFQKDLVWIFVNCNRMWLNFWSDTSKLLDRKLLYSARKNKQTKCGIKRGIGIWKLIVYFFKFKLKFFKMAIFYYIISHQSSIYLY